MGKIKHELSDSNTGWEFKQVMDLIEKIPCINYHKVHIYRLLHRWGFSSKVPQKRYVRTASQKEKKGFKKGQEGYWPILKMAGMCLCRMNPSSCMIQP